MLSVGGSVPGRPFDSTERRFGAVSSVAIISTMEGTLHGRSDSDLEVLPPEDAGGSPPVHGAHDGSGIAADHPRSRSTRAVVVCLVAAVIVMGVVAAHFERQAITLRGRLNLAQQTRPNLGELAYDGGTTLALLSPAGTEVTATVTFVQVRGAPAESVWVAVRAGGFDPNVEFDLETQGCDGTIGYSLDRGGNAVAGALVLQTEKLGLPRQGGAYNVVVRRYRGVDVAGLTIRADKSVQPLPLGGSGC